MGARAELWSRERLADMAVFFAQVGYKPTAEWKEEIVFWDPMGVSKTPGMTAPGRAAVTAVGEPPAAPAPEKKPEVDARGKGKPGPAVKPAPVSALARTVAVKARFPDGTRVELPAERDPREVFADWLVSPKYPWFTRAAVNRTWTWLLGRGIVHEADDLRAGNAPSNSALLNYLNEEFIDSRCDQRQLIRLILNSHTWQPSSLRNDLTAEAAAQFAAYPIRRLDAEVLIDAINRITGTTDLYTSPIPEPFTYIPKDMTAVAIADGSITSPFLALFGRSARATGMESERNNKNAAQPVAPPPQQQSHSKQTAARSGDHCTRAVGAEAEVHH